MARNIEDVTGQAVRRRTSQPVGSSLGLGPPFDNRQPSQPSRPQREVTERVPATVGLSGPRPSVTGQAVRRRNPEQPPTAPTGPRVGTPGGVGVHEPGRGGLPPGAVVTETPPPLSTGGGAGFTPSGNPLADLDRFFDGPANNENFLELLNAMKAAYPGRVSDVGPSATGVWDKIVIDGQTYDLIQSATGDSGRWMKMREGPHGGGGSFGGGMAGGGGTVNIGNDPFSQSIMGAFASLLARPPSGLADQALAVAGQGRQNQVNPEAQLGVLQRLIQNAPTDQSASAFPGFEPILDLLTRRQQ